jgi:hypothetical protein
MALRISSMEAILLWAVECLILLQAKAHSRAHSRAWWSKSPFGCIRRLMKKARGEISVRISLRSSSSRTFAAHTPGPWPRSTAETTSEWT